MPRAAPARPARRTGSPVSVAEAWLRDRPVRSALVHALAFILLGTASWLYTHWDLPWLLRSGDAQEYAVMARQLAAGSGFSTTVVFPAELSFGVEQDRPALVRPPLWPLLLSALFRVAGPGAAVVHLAVLACHILAIAAAGLIASRLAGRGAGAIASLATATTPQFVAFTVDGVSEPLFAACVGVAFLLCARGAHPFAIGATCGLALLTRPNGAVLLPALLLFLLFERRSLAPLAWCAAGFATVVAPWWLRTWSVTGDPFYSPLSLNLYVDPGALGSRASPFYEIEPDTAPGVALQPLDKALGNLHTLLVRFPLAAANLSACLGVALACVRRDRLSLAFAFAIAATTAGIALALPNGRYFAPFVPVLSALGAAGWMRFGRRLRVPMLALLLVAPLLPGPPHDLPDVALLRGGIPRARQAERDGARSAEREQREAEAWRRCLGDGDLVLAYAAARVAWQTKAVAIYQPRSSADFWWIVEQYPVRFVQTGDPRAIGRERFDAHFLPRAECGADIYERRDAARPRTRGRATTPRPG